MLRSYLVSKVRGKAMKKQPKKVRLSRETLRDLGAASHSKVAGGTTDETRYRTCSCPSWCSCDSCTC
jgi:hypothetical protein